jgi:hypothetical protein
MIFPMRTTSAGEAGRRRRSRSRRRRRRRGRVDAGARAPNPIVSPPCPQRWTVSDGTDGIVHRRTQFNPKTIIEVVEEVGEGGNVATCYMHATC